jgi:hypothetical protein
LPSFPAAGQGEDVGVAHLLQNVGGEGGAEATPAVQNQFSGFVGDGGFDVAFDDAFAEVQGAGGVGCLPFVVFAYVDESRGLVCSKALRVSSTVTSRMRLLASLTSLRKPSECFIDLTLPFGRLLS